MIDELGNYISAEFGRCDRSSSCGYCKYPQKSNLDVNLYLTQRKVAKLTFIDEPPSTISEWYVQQSLKGYNINMFYQYLCTMYERQDVDSVFAAYNVGTSKFSGGSTVFWQISIENQVRSGKIIKFDDLTGKRIKEPRPLMTWVHKILHLEKFNLKQVLFGEHLLSQFPQKAVCVVESERTVIIMSLKHPNFLWLATGSKQEFKLEKLKVLSGRKVLVFPDTDAFEEWKKKADIISKQLNLNLVVSSYLMNCTIAIDQKKGYDLADFNQIKIDNANLIQPINKTIHSD